ncbi:MAG: hypothetical protein ACI37Q_02265 [Candidatus Gastranaerophilaceae bacterium]
MNINPLNDAENIRQQRNLTNSQRKTSVTTKEGVLVNNLIKDRETDLSETRDTYLISDKVSMPSELYSDNRHVDKKLLPLSGIALGVMSVFALATLFVNRCAKIAKNLPQEKWLPALTRNVNLSNESHQIVYQMLQSPSKKTFIAGLGALAFGAMAFMGGAFFDGYKEIWVRRKEADIQKNLQEELVAVETQSFSGKMQIIRSMMSKYTADFEKYISPNGEKMSTNFGKHLYSKVPFMSSGGDKDKSKKSNVWNILLGIGTFAGIVGLGFVSLKNLTKSRIHIEDGITRTKNLIKEVVKTSSEATKELDKDNLEHMFRSIEASSDAENFIKEQVNILNWKNNDEKQKFLDKILTYMRTSTTKANPNYAGDGTPKPAFNSFVNEYLAFFYNWLLDTSNPQFKYLFLGITGVTAVGYGGKLAADAIKEVQVKKINAETELELQKRLVSTELRNFKSKKDAAVRPLVEEFYKQVDSGNRSQEKLKMMAENILFEIKNGPPFVYS